MRGIGHGHKRGQRPFRMRFVQALKSGHIAIVRRIRHAQWMNMHNYRLIVMVMWRKTILGRMYVLKRRHAKRQQQRQARLDDDCAAQHIPIMHRHAHTSTDAGPNAIDRGDCREDHERLQFVRQRIVGIRHTSGVRLGRGIRTRRQPRLNHRRRVPQPQAWLCMVRGYGPPSPL